MGFRTAILEKSKAKSSTSSVVPTSHASFTHNIFHHNPQRQNSSSETSYNSTPRRSQAIEEEQAVLDPDSYEAFLVKAERDERERVEVEELEKRIKKRTESWDQEQKRKDGGTRAWLAQNGLTR